jgi:hypothetical protein
LFFFRLSDPGQPEAASIALLESNFHHHDFAQAFQRSRRGNQSGRKLERAFPKLIEFQLFPQSGPPASNPQTSEGAAPKKLKSNN